MQVGAWLFDGAEGVLRRAGASRGLSPRLADLLAFLVASAPRVVSKRAILDAVWSDRTVGESALTQRIMELRRRLGDDPRQPRYIETVARRGYRLIARVGQPGHSDDLRAGTGGAAITVTLADFGAGTGHRDATEAFMETVERALGQTVGLRVVPRTRLAAALRRMRSADDAPLDPETAVAAARRDGEIALLVHGSLRRLDHTFALELRAVDVADTERVRWLGATHRGEHGLVEAMQRLADQLGRHARELGATADRLGTGWPLVTTRSEDALASYLRALERVDAFEWGKARDLLAAAVRHDPDFGLAWAWLAFAYLWLEQPDAAEEAAARCGELSAVVSERERHLLQATRAAFHGELEEVIDHLELLHEVDPEDFWGAFRLAQCFAVAGRTEDSLRLRETCARLRPDHVMNSSEAAFTRLFAASDLEGAAREYARVLELDPHHPFALPFLVRSFQAWVAGDLELAGSQVERVLKDRVGGFLPLGKVSARVHAARLRLFQGRAGEALRLLDRAIAEAAEGSSIEGWVRGELALTLADLGHIEAFLAQLEMLDRSSTPLNRAHAALWRGLHGIGTGDRRAGEVAVRAIDGIARGQWWEFGFPVRRAADTVIRGFTLLLEGYGRLSKGRPGAALQSFAEAAEALPLAVEGPVAFASTGPRAHLSAREGFALSHAAAGDLTSALAAEDWLVEHPVELFITSRAGVGCWYRALARRAELSLREGDRQSARDDALQVIEGWGGLDPTPEPVRTARKVLTV